MIHFRIFLKKIIISNIRGSSRIEDAVECYQRAGNLFKMAKNWVQAAKAFCDAANLHSRSGARHEAATNYVDAANCYKKVDVKGKTTNCLRLISFGFISTFFQRL